MKKILCSLVLATAILLGTASAFANNTQYYDIKSNGTYETKLNRLCAELQKHTKANTNYLDTGLKILDLCHKASFPATELSTEEVAQIIREVYLNATIKNKKVTVIFREPFATIEKLVKLAKQGIAEVGLAEFKSAIISSKDIDAESIKKEPEGSDFNSSTCIKWWRLGDSNS